jgi:septal ring factor EnvC (AmiA/AmiB activator)
MKGPNKQFIALARCNKVLFLLLLVLSCMVAPGTAWGQSKKDLEEKRKKILRDIETTQRMIKKTARTKEATYDRYIALQSQIQSREALIQTLEAEIQETEEGISRNQQVINSLSVDVNRMREEYGQTVRNAFRRKTLSSPLLYILSAESLNQAFRRWLFLRKYDERRKEQAEAIRFTQEMLSRKNSGLQETRVEKAALLESVQGQKLTLSQELTEKDVILKDLNKDEARLKSDLEKKRAAHEALNTAIEAIIQEEVRKRIEEARSKPKPVAEAAPKESARAPEKSTESKVIKPSEPAKTPEISTGTADNLTLNFQKNKGRLPWPVESGFVSRGYGKQRHPTLKNIEITNNGVDIRTEEGASVRSVADGKVAGVQFVPGHDYTVILQHGDYYTVYTNLSSTSLSKGQEVKSKQTIGQVSTNNITGTSELHFEVWQQKERMNPSLWIKK